MFGGRMFGNVWDPYGVAYAHPQPRYYRPQADRYDVPVDHPIEQPSSKKTVKTILVTDGGVPERKPVAKSEDAAATEIQASYRGYVVRKMQPLHHLKVIKKVKAELEALKSKSQEAEQRTKLRTDSKERLRWTEAVMALLLRLDSLQGVHPDVRPIRKAVTKELIDFQETIDSMSTVVSEKPNDEISHETVDSVADPAPEEVEQMEIEENVPRGVEEEFAAEGGFENSSDDVGVKSNEDLTCDKHVPPASLAPDDRDVGSVTPDFDENGSPASEIMLEVEGTSISKPLPEGSPLMSFSTHDMEVCEVGKVDPASSQSLPPEAGNQEVEMDVSQVDLNEDNPNPTIVEEKELADLGGLTVPATISTQSMMLEPQCEQDGKLGDVNASSDRSALLQVLMQENRELKDMLGRVLDSDKQQTDAIQKLTQRIARLEERRSPSELLHGVDRKRERSVENVERPRRRLEKGRRSCRRHRDYVDSEDWLSVESDDYF